MIISHRERLEALEEGLRSLGVRIVVTREANGTATVFVEDFCGWEELHTHTDWEEAMAVWEARLAGSLRRKERTAA